MEGNDSPSPSIVWFRLDLRLADHPALDLAVRSGGAVIPLFIWAPEEDGAWPPGAASRWWLHHSLEALDGALRARGSRLVIRRGPALGALRELVRATGARAVFWNRRYEPAWVTRDGAIKDALRSEGLRVESANSALLHEPWTIRNRAGNPFQVFTPFWRACLAQADPAEPIEAPRSLAAPARWPRSEALDALGLLPGIRWDSGLAAAWTPGERGARARLDAFCKGPVVGYGDRRNHPAMEGTSRLSPHLHFGEVGPRQVWHAARLAAEREGVAAARWRAWPFLAELGWREFGHHLLFHFPHTPAEPLRTEFAAFPWRRDEALWRAWTRGRTGYPLVDAGMRELWHTGWMHNRVRMVVGSFLVKNLLHAWQEGARWFWDTLVDADLASNTLGWQWVAGCGADAAPYFRIFNPVAQGEKFDPDGVYVRRWIPELSGLDARHLHKPWQAPEEVLRAAGVRLGDRYPQPVVSPSASRIAALDAFARLRGRSKAG